MIFQCNASGISALPSVLPPPHSSLSSPPWLLSWWFHERSCLPAVPSFQVRQSSPSQVMAVQTQFPQAHTQRLQSTSVSAPSAYVSSSRAHSVGPGIRRKSLGWRWNRMSHRLCTLRPACPSPYLSKCHHQPKDLWTWTSAWRWCTGAHCGIVEDNFLRSGEFHPSPLSWPPQNAPTPYNPPFLRLVILFSGGLKDGLRHLRNSWKLSFQSAFSSDSSISASTQSPLKWNRRYVSARPQLHFQRKELSIRIKYTWASLSGQGDCLKRQFLHWPPTTMMHADSCKHSL